MHGMKSSSEDKTSDGRGGGARSTEGRARSTEGHGRYDRLPGDTHSPAMSHAPDMPPSDFLSAGYPPPGSLPPGFVPAWFDRPFMHMVPLGLDMYNQSLLHQSLLRGVAPSAAMFPSHLMHAAAAAALGNQPSGLLHHPNVAAAVAAAMYQEQRGNDSPMCLVKTKATTGESSRPRSGDKKRSGGSGSNDGRFSASPADLRAGDRGGDIPRSASRAMDSHAAGGHSTPDQADARLIGMRLMEDAQMRSRMSVDPRAADIRSDAHDLRGVEHCDHAALNMHLGGMDAHRESVPSERRGGPEPLLRIGLEFGHTHQGGGRSSAEPPRLVAAKQQKFSSSADDVIDFDFASSLRRANSHGERSSVDSFRASFGQVDVHEAVHVRSTVPDPPPPGRIGQRSAGGSGNSSWLEFGGDSRENSRTPSNSEIGVDAHSEHGSRLDVTEAADAVSDGRQSTDGSCLSAGGGGLAALGDAGSTGAGVQGEADTPSAASVAASRMVSLPPRKRILRHPEELGACGGLVAVGGAPDELHGGEGVGVRRAAEDSRDAAAVASELERPAPSGAGGSGSPTSGASAQQSVDSPSSSLNFRTVWKKFAAKSTPAPSAGGTAGAATAHRAFLSGKPIYGLLGGKPFAVSGKPRGFFHRAGAMARSPRYGGKPEAAAASMAAGGLADGSSSPRVTRSQSKRKKKDSPKHSPSDAPPTPVRKSMRKKTANSKYDLKEQGARGKGKGKGAGKGAGKDEVDKEDEPKMAAAASGEATQVQGDAPIEAQAKTCEAEAGLAAVTTQLIEREMKLGVMEKKKDKGERGSTGEQDSGDGESRSSTSFPVIEDTSTAEPTPAAAASDSTKTTPSQPATALDPATATKISVDLPVKEALSSSSDQDPAKSSLPLVESTENASGDVSRSLPPKFRRTNRTMFSDEDGTKATSDESAASAANQTKESVPGQVKVADLKVVLYRADGGAKHSPAASRGTTMTKETSSSGIMTAPLLTTQAESARGKKESDKAIENIVMAESHRNKDERKEVALPVELVMDKSKEIVDVNVSSKSSISCVVTKPDTADRHGVSSGLSEDQKSTVIVLKMSIDPSNEAADAMKSALDPTKASVVMSASDMQALSSAPLASTSTLQLLPSTVKSAVAAHPTAEQASSTPNKGETALVVEPRKTLFEVVGECSAPGKGLLEEQSSVTSKEDHLSVKGKESSSDLEKKAVSGGENLPSNVPPSAIVAEPWGSRKEKGKAGGKKSVGQTLNRLISVSDGTILNQPLASCQTVVKPAVDKSVTSVSTKQNSLSKISAGETTEMPSVSSGVLLPPSALLPVARRSSPVMESVMAKSSNSSDFVASKDQGTLLKPSPLSTSESCDPLKPPALPKTSLVPTTPITQDLLTDEQGKSCGKQRAAKRAKKEETPTGSTPSGAKSMRLLSIPDPCGAKIMPDVAPVMSEKQRKLIEFELQQHCASIVLSTTAAGGGKRKSTSIRQQVPVVPLVSALDPSKSVQPAPIKPALPSPSVPPAAAPPPPTKRRRHEDKSESARHASGGPPVLEKSDDIAYVEDVEDVSASEEDEGEEGPPHLQMSSGDTECAGDMAVKEKLVQPDKSGSKSGRTKDSRPVKRDGDLAEISGNSALMLQESVLVEALKNKSRSGANGRESPETVVSNQGEPEALKLASVSIAALAESAQMLDDHKLTAEALKLAEPAAVGDVPFPVLVSRVEKPTGAVDAPQGLRRTVSIVLQKLSTPTGDVMAATPVTDPPAKPRTFPEGPNDAVVAKKRRNERVSEGEMERRRELEERLRASAPPAASASSVQVSAPAAIVPPATEVADSRRKGKRSKAAKKAASSPAFSETGERRVRVGSGADRSSDGFVRSTDDDSFDGLVSTGTELKTRLRIKKPKPVAATTGPQDEAKETKEITQEVSLPSHPPAKSSSLSKPFTIKTISPNQSFGTASAQSLGGLSDFSPTSAPVVAVVPKKKPIYCSALDDRPETSSTGQMKCRFVKVGRRWTTISDRPMTDATDESSDGTALAQDANLKEDVALQEIVAAPPPRSYARPRDPPVMTPIGEPPHPGKAHRRGATSRKPRKSARIPSADKPRQPSAITDDWKRTRFAALAAAASNQVALEQEKEEEEEEDEAVFVPVEVSIEDIHAGLLRLGYRTLLMDGLDDRYADNLYSSRPGRTSTFDSRPASPASEAAREDEDDDSLDSLGVCPESTFYVRTELELLMEALTLSRRVAKSGQSIVMESGGNLAEHLERSKAPEAAFQGRNAPGAKAPGTTFEELRDRTRVDTAMATVVGSARSNFRADRVEDGLRSRQAGGVSIHERVPARPACLGELNGFQFDRLLCQPPSDRGLVDNGSTVVIDLSPEEIADQQLGGDAVVLGWVDSDMTEYDLFSNDLVLNDCEDLTMGSMAMGSPVFVDTSRYNPLRIY